MHNLHQYQMILNGSLGLTFILSLVWFSITQELLTCLAIDSMLHHVDIIMEFTVKVINTK